MAKFALIRAQIISEKDVKDFSKYYTTSRLLKQFKCKTIIELKNHKEFEEDENFSKIDSCTLAELVTNIFEADRDVFPNANLGRRQSVKLFMFSDDAESSAFALDVLQDKVNIMLFNLNNEDVMNLSRNLDIAATAKDALSTIDDIETMISSLENHGNDFGINIIDSYGEGKVSQLKDKTEKERDDAISEIEEILSRDW